MEFAFEKIFPQLKELEIGINLANNEEYRKVSLYLLHAVFDKPARAAALNMVNSTGFHSCLKCIQSGKSIKTASMCFKIKKILSIFIN